MFDSISDRGRGSRRAAVGARGPHLLPPEVVRVDLPLLADSTSEGDRVGPLDSPRRGDAASLGAISPRRDRGACGNRIVREHPIISRLENNYQPRTTNGERVIRMTCNG